MTEPHYVLHLKLEKVEMVTSEIPSSSSYNRTPKKVSETKTTEMVSLHTKGLLPDVIRAARINLSLFSEGGD